MSGSKKNRVERIAREGRHSSCYTQQMDRRQLARRVKVSSIEIVLSEMTLRRGGRERFDLLVPK